MKSLSTAFAAMLLLSWSALSGATQTNAAPFSGDVHIVNARIITGTDAAPLEGATLLVIRDGRVHLVTNDANKVAETLGKTPNKDVQIIDLKGHTIIPALISAHAHIGQTDGVTSTPETFNKENILRQLKQFEAYGVTTVGALGLNRPLVYELIPDLNSGRLKGANVLSADRGIGVFEGNPGGGQGRFAADQVDRPKNAKEAREAVAASKSRGAHLIKIWVDSSGGKVPRMTSEIVKAVVEEAHKHNLKVASHIFSLADAKEVVKAGVDIVAHGVRDQPVDDEFITLLKERGVYYVPTIALDEAGYIYAESHPWMKESFFKNSVQPALQNRFDSEDWRKEILGGTRIKTLKANVTMNQRNTAILHEAGIPIGKGTDAGAFPERIPGFAEHRELQLLLEAGIEPADVVRISTRNSAQALGLKNEGTLEVGKKANFIVLKGNPLEDTKNFQSIEQVWHHGQKASGSVSEFRP